MNDHVRVVLRREDNKGWDVLWGCNGKDIALAEAVEMKGDAMKLGRQEALSLDIPFLVEEVVCRNVG